MDIKLKHKKIGELDFDTHTFRKVVSLKRHLFREADAWGIDAHIFDGQLYPNNFFIEITDVDEQKIYRTDAHIFKEKGFYKHFKTELEDYGLQIFLKRIDFNN